MSFQFQLFQNSSPRGNAVGLYNTYNTPYYPPYSESFIPHDPYNSYSNYSAPYYPQNAPAPIDQLPDIAIDVARLSPGHSPVQEPAEILEEIVRECEAIERRSSPSSIGSSPTHQWLSSSDEYENSDSPGPYRNPVKKERKKAQNRLAATRYREKKRKEKEDRMSVVSDLLSRNEELKKQVSTMESEIVVLKKLMMELGVHN